MTYHLWNYNESGMQDHLISKQLVGGGKSCFQVTSGEKGEITTVLATFNAVGTFTPTMKIFKVKWYRAEWLEELFLEWGQRFVQQLPKEDPRPHVLLLDGHYSHVFYLQILELMKWNNVHVMSYLPHAWPPDCRQITLKPELFWSLKHHWQELGHKWTRKTGRRKLQNKPFFVFTPTWNKAVNTENAHASLINN